MVFDKSGNYLYTKADNKFKDIKLFRRDLLENKQKLLEEKVAEEKNIDLT